MLQLRTLFCSSTAGKNVTSVCVIHMSPVQKHPSLILLNHYQGSAQAGLRTFFPAVEAGFLWSRCGNKFHLEQVGQCKQLLVQLGPEGEAASGGAGCRT